MIDRWFAIVRRRDSIFFKDYINPLADKLESRGGVVFGFSSDMFLKLCVAESS